MKTVKIVWNGCDSYTEWDFALESADYKIHQGALITKTESFTPFEVEHIDMKDVPTYDDGEKNFEGLYLTENGNAYKLLEATDAQH
jgi:hypothetical protein